MDSNTNDPDPEIPPEVSPEQLEEALKWLEELAGRPDVAPQADVAAMPADVSPFQGLIDSEGEDAPDWLNDAPPAAEESLADEGEFESRLDWLAKMTERESMEELPTLEWRRISDAAAQQASAESARLPDEAVSLPLPEAFSDEHLPIVEAPAEPVVAEAVLHMPDSPEDGIVAPAESEMEPSLEALPRTQPDEALESGIEPLEALPQAQPDEALKSEIEPLEALPPGEPDVATLDLSEAAINPETLLDSLPPDVELPPIDDLDAAMAWIEELAASQDAPIEDVPSVANRALASKLLREAGISPESLDLRGSTNEMSLGDLSLLEGNTPINAFVAAEDFADTIVLMETMAADQGRTLEEPPPPATVSPAPPQATDLAAPATNEDSFEGAMAFLDELAAAQEPPGSTTQPIEPVEMTAGPAAGELALEQVVDRADKEWAQPEWLTEPATETAATDAEALAQDSVELAEPIELAELTEPAEPAEQEAWPAEMVEPAAATQAEAMLPEEAPWIELDIDRQPLSPAEDEPAGELPADMAMPATMARRNGDDGASLEETLLALDALALPPGASLAEIDSSLRQSGGLSARRDLPAAVEWLELSLGLSGPLPAAPLSDEDLIARMPEDPDAVLAWLEQMAEEDTVDSSPSLPVEEAAPAAAVANLAPSAGVNAEPVLEELSEADLLNMPEDPDAIIAWLEGLAGNSAANPPEPSASPAAILAEEPATPETAADLGAPAALEAPVLESGAEEARPWPDVDTEAGLTEATPGDKAPAEAAVESAPAEGVTVATLPADARPRVAARPRRRGRRATPVVEATAAEAAREETTPAAPEAAEVSVADVTTVTVEAATGIVAQEQATVEESEAAAAPKSEEPPAPPARPASWVDLLKPLR